MINYRGKRGMDKEKEKEKYKGIFINTDNLKDGICLYRSYAECENLRIFKKNNPHIKTDIYNKYLEAYRNS